MVHVEQGNLPAAAEEAAAAAPCRTRYPPRRRGRRCPAASRWVLVRGLSGDAMSEKPLHLEPLNELPRCAATCICCLTAAACADLLGLCSAALHIQQQGHVLLTAPH